jgi:hypothetical protein
MACFHARSSRVADRFAPRLLEQRLGAQHLSGYDANVRSNRYSVGVSWHRLAEHGHARLAKSNDTKPSSRNAVSASRGGAAAAAPARATRARPCRTAS